MSGGEISGVLAVFFVALTVIAPAVLIFRDNRRPLRARALWTIACVMSCPLFFVLFSSTFRTFPEIAHFAPEEIMVRIKWALFGLSFCLPYFTLLYFRRYGKTPKSTVESNAHESGTRDL
jgi:hypothetical protein